MIEHDEIVEKLMQVDSLAWAHHKRLQLSDGVRFELAGRPYLVGLVGCDKRVLHCKKGSQVCITTAKYVEALHACVYRRFDKNIIYMLPTVRQAETLSKVSFDPIFRFNGFLKKMVSNDSASIKTVNGRSIVFVGAQSQKVGDSNAKDSIGLRSIPADAVYRDEIDLMDEDMVEISKQRLNASRFRIENNYGSPTIPNYGIDSLYDSGDQRKWQIPCKACGKYTCLVESFPRSIICKDNRWFRACSSCSAEIFVSDGDWVAEYRDRTDASFWIDGLISPMADLGGYMHRYHNADGTKLAEFERSILGRATIEASCQLGIGEILANSCPEGLRYYSESQTVMGIDVGDKLHVVVGQRTGKETYRVLNISTVSSFGEVHDLAKKMNVGFCVIDKGPDIHGVKSFQEQESYPVFRCLYNDFMMGAPDFDRETKVVKCNRNEMCDRVHDAFISNKITIPRECPEIRDYAEQLTKMAKDTQAHPETGIQKTRWIKLGNKNDHFFHSTLYMMLAASKVSPSRDGMIKKQIKLKNKFVL